MIKINPHKVILFIILFTIFCINPSYAQNYQTTDNTLQMIQNQIQKFDKDQQISKYQLFVNIMTKAIKKTNKQQDKDRYRYIADFFQDKLNILEGENIDIETSNITNINQQTIQDRRLTLHNQERINLWLAPYIINQNLNNTAQKRANHLAKVNYATHKRKSSDKYYNYNSIKEWFQNNWVNFPKEQNWIAWFSENIARQTFKCNQNDCTDYFLWQTNKTFQFFMSEKPRLWSHYRAIISPHFQEIWLWYAKIWNKFFIVTHYWNFK